MDLYKLDAAKLLSLLKAEKGLTWERIAEERGGPSVRTMKYALKGKLVKRSTLDALANAFNVEPEELTVPDRRVRTVSLSTEEVVAKLRDGGYGSSACCAFVAGDFSVLTTKRAFVLPVGAKVHVSVQAAKNDTAADAYFPKAGGGWIQDAVVSSFIARRLERALDATTFRTWFNWCPPALHVTVVSEIPAGFALYEESALALAIARALGRMYERPAAADALEQLSLAAALLTGFYADVSWATLIACNEDPESLDDVLFFDRRRSKVDLVKLFNGDHTQLAANTRPKNKFWDVEKLDLDVGMLSIWWGEAFRMQVQQRARFRRKFDTFNCAPLSFVLDQMQAAMASSGDEDFYRKLGWLMQLHQLILATGGFVDREPQEAIARVNGLPGVLGAKLACGRGNGALIVLADDGIDRDALAASMLPLGLKPLQDFRSELEIDIV